jgi:hypothetical protein
VGLHFATTTKALHLASHGLGGKSLLLVGHTSIQSPGNMKRRDPLGCFITSGTVGGQMHAARAVSRLYFTIALRDPRNEPEASTSSR